MSVDPQIAWLLLIYTVPRTPSRLRATIWRELKKVGAIYLRDGVCVLPRREDTDQAITRIAEQVRAFGGQATVATSQLDAETVAAIVAKAGGARAAEYVELAQEVEHLLAHVAREREHRELTYHEAEGLEADLEKLRRWFNQIRARDYFPVSADQQRVATLLTRGDEALAGYLDDVYTRI